jgi:periplasmic divalent cation tolerance protein
MLMPDEYVIVLSTLPPGGETARLAGILVEERLAACVNLLPPMTSTYRWAGAVETATEHQVVVKTTRARVAALWERLRALHPYDVPEFVVLPIVDGNDAYLKWIGESTGQEVPEGSNRDPGSEP